MRSAATLSAACLLLSAGCPSKSETPAGPVPDTECPKSAPIACKVLLDKLENNAVDYHVLVAEGTKHGEAEALIKFLYRYLWTRYPDAEPASGGAYIYTTESAFRTPPRTPVAQFVRKAGTSGPSFENKVPLEFSQEVDFAVHPRRDNETEEAYQKRRADEEKAPLKIKIEREDAQRLVTLTYPYAEPDDKGNVSWMETLSFNQAMNGFTDSATELFRNVNDLRMLTFIGLHKDKEVLRIEMTRTDYNALGLLDMNERIGQHHGRAFLELATNKTNDAQAARNTNARIAGEYKKMLAQLKGKAKVDPALK